MPHLYKPWKHDRPDEHATSFPASAVDRRALRDASMVRVAGIGLVALSVVAFVLGASGVGFGLFTLGLAMVILDAGLLMIFGVAGWVLLALARLLLRTSRRMLLALRGNGSRA